MWTLCSAPFIVLSNNGPFKLYSSLISPNLSHIGCTGQRCRQEVDCKVQKLLG